MDAYGRWLVPESFLRFANERQQEMNRIVLSGGVVSAADYRPLLRLIMHLRNGQSSAVMAVMAFDRGEIDGQQLLELRW